MMFGKQEQSAGDGGTAIQAGGNVVVVQGVSASEVRQIALDVFQANFFRARGAAMEIAKARGEQITDKVVSKLERENPEGLNQASTPDFQDAIFTVQKEYAKAGDERLGDLLVDLLVDRSKHPNRDLMQLVLNESLHTAPKLTAAQINTLSVIFVLRHVVNNGLDSLAKLREWFEQLLRPPLGEMAASRSTFQHLEFTGCGTASFSVVNLENAWTEQYQGIFMRGFDTSRLEWANLRPELRQALVIPCLNDPGRLQIAALNRQVLMQKIAGVANVTDDERGRIDALYAEGSVDAAIVKEGVLSAIPWLAGVHGIWESSGMGGFQLTSVGMAIGHANVKRLVGEFAPLSIWIQEQVSAKA